MDKEKLMAAYKIFRKHYMLVERIMKAYFLIDDDEITFEDFCIAIEAKQTDIQSVTVFIDMDNCLAHFSNGKLDDETVLERARNKGFFRNLEKMDEDIEIYQALYHIGFNIYVLSKCMDTPYCRSEKLEWMQEHMSWLPKEKIILCDIEDDKAKIAMDKASLTDLSRAILIDDYKGNLIKWSEMGGISIKKAISFKPNRPYPTLINHRDAPYFIFGIALN